MPYFSIVIPTLNEEINLPILLQSLTQQTLRDFEVIISDSNSEDRTKEKALSFSKRLSKLIFITKPKRNVSLARNAGAKMAKGKYLVFLDADTKVEADFLEEVKKHIVYDKVDFLSFWNRTESRRWEGKIIFAVLNAVLMLSAKIKPVVNGPCMIVAKDLFYKIGGFNKEIVFGEDSDLVQRLHKIGAKIGIYQKPILYVSTRRFEKEGFLKSISKSVSAVIYQNVFGVIKKPLFDYEMGGQYYKKIKYQKSNIKNNKNER